LFNLYSLCQKQHAIILPQNMPELGEINICYFFQNLAPIYHFRPIKTACFLIRILEIFNIICKIYDNFCQMCCAKARARALNNIFSGDHICLSFSKRLLKFLFGTFDQMLCCPCVEALVGQPSILWQERKVAEVAPFLP